MRILQLGKFYPIRGGVEKVMWNLTRGVSEQGLDCDMLCARRPSDATDFADRQYSIGKALFCFNPHGHVYCVSAWCKLAATMIAPGMIFWLFRHRKAYDIIHIHHPDPMAALALRLSGFRGKVVLHWHSDILSQKVWLALYKPLQRWLIRRADVIVGTSPAYLQGSPYLKDVQEKCVAVPIGIEPLITDKKSVEKLRRQFPEGKLLLTIGRLVPYKGLSFLIEAMSLLPEHFHLVIGGEGPLKKKLQEQVADAHLEQRVFFTGYIDAYDLPDWFGACDIFILPSIFKTEAFGIVQLEAMSCGKPVVATRIPDSGVPWVNEDGVSGKNAEPSDPQSLAEAILEVENRWDEYASGARKRFESLFTEEKMIKTIIGIYENLS